jgi:hypothetical protein
MEHIRNHYLGSSGNSLLTDRFKFWQSTQSPLETILDWEVKVREAGNLSNYNQLTDIMCRDKFIFGLHNPDIRTKLLRSHTHSKGKTDKSMSDVVAEAKAIETAQAANKIIIEANKIEEQVNWTQRKMSHRDMKLQREPGTYFLVW